MGSLRHAGRRRAIKRAVRLVRHLLVVLALGLVAGAQAGAAPAGPHWSIVSQAQPSHFKAGDTADAYRLIARNDGAGPTSGTVTLSDVLPEGVAASKVTARAEGANGSGSPRYELICTTLPVACTYEEGTSQRALAPGTTIVMTIKVSIAAGLEATELENLATVSGGGAPSASAEESTPVSLAAVPFGLSYLDIGATEESGEADTQAGSHPYELTASLAFTIGSREAPSAGNDESESPLSNSSAKDLEVELPPGLVGDPRNRSTARSTRRSARSPAISTGPSIRLSTRSTTSCRRRASRSSSASRSPGSGTSRCSSKCAMTSANATNTPCRHA
jgi:uncharacterized repeat protein (TIGR01451 family)